MRLVTVNMTLDPESGGGSAGRTVQFTRALLDLGVDCTVVTTGSAVPAAVASQLGGVAVVTLPALGGRFRVPYANWRALADGVSSADVVLLMNHWAPLNLLAWRAAVRAGTPYVVCPAGALPVEGRSRALKRGYNFVGGRRLVRDADAHIAVTAAERAQFASYGVDPSRVAVVPNGMPTLRAGDAGSFRARLGLGPGPILLFIGRLAPIKGPDLLLEAFDRVSQSGDGADWQLVLAGPDDGLLAALRARVASSGSGRVHLIGFLDEQAKADALAAADLVAVPSRREAMSIVVLEAAAAGRPVLVTDQCGVPEVADSGGGWVVEASADAIAEGLAVAMRDPDRLPQRGAAWRRHASEQFAWTRVGRTLLELLSSVATRRRAR